MNEPHVAFYKSPIGVLKITAAAGTITALEFLSDTLPDRSGGSASRTQARLRGQAGDPLRGDDAEIAFQNSRIAIRFAEATDFGDCFQQLDEYFAHRRQQFSLKLNPQGTAFQKRVWQHLLKIPFGKTTSYLEIAEALGARKALRAVGAANGRNPIPIIIPCHRVIGRDGDLIGFGGGIWRKEWLLRHEGVVLI